MVVTGSLDGPRTASDAARSRANLRNGATRLGRWLARRAGVPLAPGPYGLELALGYPRRFPAPRAGAVCVGDVVLLRHSTDVLRTRPRLLLHEARHAMQWARWGGPVGFVPAYLVASAWSWLRTGDVWSANGFEVAAGLADGGYTRSVRSALARAGWVRAGSRRRPRP